MPNRLALARAYLSQQVELGMPDAVLGPGAAALVSRLSQAAPAQPGAAQSSVPPAMPPAARPAPGKTSAAARLVPASRLMGQAPAQRTSADTGGADNVRDAFVALFKAEKECAACGLASTRTNLVFGSGNVHAPLMVVGEAPGADEDAQGLPFVGAAGAMLTKMLAAIGLNRTQDVFITNVLKCRPPNNRTPEGVEVDACKRILFAQIALLKPRVFLLLGRVAAHALLGLPQSITEMRREIHFVQGVPAFVTYHPAALLHNPDNKRPAWEDLKKLKAYLTEQGIYAASK